MPRFQRVVLPGQPMHIRQRGANRLNFLATDDDRAFYLRHFHEVSERSGCQVHAYALMTNHVHFIVTPEHPRSAASMMQRLNSRFVRYFNPRQGRTGPLWEGRYGSTVIDSESYFYTCLCYVDLNASRAGLVLDPSDFPWSSCRANALGHLDSLVTPHPLYLLLGSSPTDRQAEYRSMLAAGLDRDVEDQIREATRVGLPLGSVRWRAAAEALLKRKLTRESHGGPRQPHVRVDGAVR